MKIEEFMQTVEVKLDTLQKFIEVEEAEGDSFKDGTAALTLTEAANLQKRLKNLLEITGGVKTKLQEMYDFMRYTRLPDIMDQNDIESMKIEGVGAVYLTSDMNVSTRAGKKEEAIDWLVQNGFGDIVQETVNASTLKAVIKKEVINKGQEPPEDIFNVSPFTRSQITK